MVGFARVAGCLANRWVEVEWLFEPRDMWIGLYWKRYPKAIEFYVCALPVLPVRVYVEWGK